MRILGLDCALATHGYSIYDTETKEEVIACFRPKKVGAHRLYEIDTFFRQLFQKEKIDIVFIEGYAYGGRGQDMGEGGGILRLMFYSLGIPYIEVVPQHLKMFVCGKGNAKKPLMMMSCLKKFDREIRDDNECDAYCLARFGVEFMELGRDQFLVKYNMNAKRDKYQEIKFHGR